tara:strand:- start:2640 stop:3161 length:522 start_codon:yes stop_codon:yes gene_type:complete
MPHVAALLRSLSLVLAVVLGAGCSGLPGQLPTEARPLSSRTRVVWLAEVAPDRDARTLAHLDAAAAVYAQRYGRAPRPRRVYLHDRAALPAGLAGRELRSRDSLLGCYAEGVREVHLQAGGGRPLRAAIHELHHAARDEAGLDPDPEHKGPEWSAINRLDRALCWRFWGWLAE